jgi:thiamine kinase-like enzyme
MNSPEQMQKSMTAFGNFFKLLIESTYACGLADIGAKIAQWDFMKLMMTFMASAESMQSGFKVLNHGDTWCNNMLFKNDSDGSSIDMRFIDYQLSFWGSPVTDLGYFMISSVADDVKVEHFDNLLLHYHEELIKALKALNYEKKVPTLSELHVDMLEKGPTGEFFVSY